MKEKYSKVSENFFPDDGSLGIKSVLSALVLVVLFVAGLGWYWSSEADHFDVVSSAKRDGEQQVVGEVSTATLIEIAQTLLDKPGGFVSNDMMPPGVFMDNQPNWEYGALIQVRDFSKAMREAFSRSQSQSTEDSDLANAESRFNFDRSSWALPASESEYRDGIKFIGKYLERLRDDDQFNAQFYARADNLRYWLTTVSSRMGNLSQRLSASVGQRRFNTDLAGDDSARQATPAPDEMKIKTPWLQIDDIFYEARGSTWALIHLLRAIEVDFDEILKKKNARVSLKQIIRELEAAQEPVYSPLILNGTGFGIMANYSLVMASYISRANAALIDLRDLLSQG